MNIINKWEEYDSGKLTAPAIVQYDTIANEHLVWVWTGDKIIQMSRTAYDEQSILADALSITEKELAMKEEIYA
jgi:hypothetical protein